MPRKKKTELNTEIRVKPRTKELGEMLAKKIFKLQFNEPTINDTIERLIILEANKYNLLNPEESQAVREYFDIGDFEYSGGLSAPVNVEYKPTTIDPIDKDYAHMAIPPVKFYPTELSKPSLLPLGNLKMEDQ